VSASRASYRRRRVVAVGVLLACAVGVWLAVAGLPGRVDAQGAQTISFTIDSRLTHGSRHAVAIVPAGAGHEARPPLLVFLHGKGQDPESSLSSNLYAALAALGPRAPIVVFPDGGEDSYWHDRAGGAWAEYVLREVIPQAERRLHADPRRVAIGGLSMGGFGAFDLALGHPGRFCAVAGRSAALWREGGETAAGAFDDARDFARHDVLGGARQGAQALAGTPSWLDVGSADPFRSADTELATELRAHARAIVFHVWPGGHDQSYWDAHWGPYMRFVAGALARCRR
jgi:enterochelin esterase-like enzyme